MLTRRSKSSNTCATRPRESRRRSWALVLSDAKESLYQLDVTTTPPATTFEVLGAGAPAVGAPSLDVLHRIIYVGTIVGAIYAIAFPLL